MTGFVHTDHGTLLDQHGDEWATAAQIAARLTSDQRPITAAHVRKWAWRARQPGDRLYGMLPGVHDADGPRTGTTWYRLLDAARVEVATRRSRTLR